MCLGQNVLAIISKSQKFTPDKFPKTYSVWMFHLPSLIFKEPASSKKILIIHYILEGN